MRTVDGVVLLDKCEGRTSNSALQAVRRLFGASKAGHTGTLDPLASGLLAIAFGEATKFSGFLFDADKSYRAVIQLGVTTDSGDADGMVVDRRAVASSDEQIESVLGGFRGEILQVPPMFSALKRRGRPLYELARRGIEVEREARRVRISRLWLERRQDDRLWLEIDCSKGTYVRALAMDIGAALGCGAHVARLRRTGIGTLRIEQAVTLETLANAGEPDRVSWLRPVDWIVRDLECLELGTIEASRFVRGLPVASVGRTGGVNLRVYAEGSFLGIGHTDREGHLRPKRLLSSSSDDRARAGCK